MERNAAKAVADAPLLDSHEDPTFSLLLQYHHQDHHPEIANDFPSTFASTYHDITLSARVDHRIFDRVSITVVRTQDIVDERSVKAAPENEGATAGDSATTTASSLLL
ncbi:hypothetical protein EmuJ_000731400 [Echinococcus multilocularis]|uniref:Uncharacterized protein n=1 Tax=Echinococcus multilocularis TaxID=6211 RepID=A0A068YC19_ECHMU|nr:hypothetical protein EmuJ_000731400 [Echinococcus multilocularis]